ncbi:unnamed protein product [Victoria cruziana]
MASSWKSMGGVCIFILLIFARMAAADDKSRCKKVACRHKKYQKCHGQVHSCPAACPRTCKVDCSQCKPVCECDQPGAVCDDPRFIGGDGITFYFHGEKDRDFCLRGEGMKRDFTWVQSIGVLYDDHKLFIGAKKVSQWDDAVDRLAIAFDGETVFLPTTEDAQWTSAALPSPSPAPAELTRSYKEESRIHDYGITDDDCFAHLDLSFRFCSLSAGVDGVLGQTYADNYRSRAKIGVKMPVLGGDREFLSSGLFATDCAAAQFRGTSPIIMSGGVDPTRPVPVPYPVPVPNY